VEESQLIQPISAQEAENLFPGPSDFVHLHNHTLFSILDGVASPEQYFKDAAARKSPAFAITEHGVLNSIPDGYLASKEFGVKFIAGVEFYYCDYDDLRKDLQNKGITPAMLKEQNQIHISSRVYRNRHLTILSKDMGGYENLLSLNKYAFENNFYYKPRTSIEQLAKFKDGLIVLSGCLNGPVSHELRADNLTTKDGWRGAVEYVRDFKNLFGDNFYVELQMPGVANDKEVFTKLVTLADHFKVKTVITNDCHYTDRKDFLIQKVMMAIDQKTTIDDPELFHVNSDDQYMKTRHELRATFIRRGYISDVPLSVFEQSCNNTLEVADKCKAFKPNLEPKLPKIDDAENKLCALALNGLKNRGLDKDSKRYFIDGREVTYYDQMIIELDRIIEKGFASYFLITLDLVSRAKREGWMMGPARGSAGGSLICFLIGIQELDPIKWGLSFNRFLSPARGGFMLNIGMPKKEKPK
jgi:DNA polymerase-3 subunit alpha